MRILLDTNICIYVMNHRPARVVERFRQYKPGEIGELDCLIAAQALSLNLPLATNNTSEFERVADLVLENWAE